MPLCPRHHDTACAARLALRASLCAPRTGIKTLALAGALARSLSLSLACLGGRLETLGETLVTTHLSLRGGSLSRARALSFSLSDASF